MIDLFKEASVLTRSELGEVKGGTGFSGPGGGTGATTSCGCIVGDGDGTCSTNPSSPWVCHCTDSITGTSYDLDSDDCDSTASL